MANREQLNILKMGPKVWNEWRIENFSTAIDLSGAYLMEFDLRQALLHEVDLRGANLIRSNLSGTNLIRANLSGSKLIETNFKRANLSEANLIEANLKRAYLNKALLLNANMTDATLDYANLSWAKLKSTQLVRALLREANLSGADLRQTSFREAFLIKANLSNADLRGAYLGKTYLSSTNLSSAVFDGCNLSEARVENAIFGNSDLRKIVGLDNLSHYGPSIISADTLALSKGNIHEHFLRGCGLSDWEIEMSKLYNPDLSNEQINNIQYKMYDLRATQALQISPLFISYSHGDSSFVDKIEGMLNRKGIRFWRDTHDLKAGRIETQIDRAINQNRTVLLILSEHSLKSDWVEHEVRTARGLEKDMGRDVLCPIALDDSWKSGPWSKRVMEQIMEYNILDFSAWEDDDKFNEMFRKLIDGLELFYKG